MSTVYHIVDNPLPLTQDFRSLKKEGLTYIQKISGNSWTNLNVSDPGVTILEQLCYALTELGYCNEFPVRDILTDPSGNLKIKDQFYLPEEILTTSPVTISDYVKSLVDNVKDVYNAIILSGFNNDQFTNGIYRVYLLVNPIVTDSKEIESICKAALYQLNNCRNIGELFFMPKVLESCSYEMSGTITIDKKTALSKILVKIQEAIQNLIFPRAVQSSYSELSKEGFETNDVFNGPKMNNGWVVANEIGVKRNLINQNDIINVIGGVDGVNSVSDIVFKNDSGNVKTNLSSDTDQIIVVDILKAVKEGKLKINSSGNEVNIEANLESSIQLIQSQNTDMQIVFGNAGNNPPEIPAGKYRDIDSYYSIQNTFPEIFAIGLDSIRTSAVEFEVAQSRQLKGYLTLFDQVLANQFSQLANIDRLFSFKNPMTAIPTSEHEYFAKKDAFQRENPEYPVPFMDFSPTYFYQALYDIPDIKPLLKDHDIFDYSDEIRNEKEQQYNSWLKYQQYPYNSYMQNLSACMENETVNIERRETILNHLLARHGESPLVLDAILDGSVYSGNSLKDRVIFKSLYLQNLGLLSYYRQKAYNFIGSDKILDYISPLKTEENRDIQTDHFVDFIFDSSRVNRNEKIQESEFRNYSALELKLGLLFGLNPLYANFIASPKKDSLETEQQALAAWLIQERKGFILVETSLLRQYQFITKSSSTETSCNSIPASDNGIELIFPEFVPEFNEDFKKRLDFFLSNTCPIHVPYKVHFIDYLRLKELIQAYVKWHNALIADNYNYLETTAQAANSLMTIMNRINQSS